MGPFEQHSERLLERGYAILPIIPGTKKPGFFHHGIWVGLMEWTKRFNGRTSLVAERQRWGRFETGIGVLGGPASSDLVGIDVDTEDPQIVAALLTILPPTEVKKAGARGETRFYYGPGIASSSWSINGKRIVEILGPGRQTVLPPTAHPDGMLHTVGWARRHWRTSSRRSCRLCRPISRYGSLQFSSPSAIAPLPREQQASRVAIPLTGRLTRRRWPSLMTGSPSSSCTRPGVRCAAMRLWQSGVHLQPAGPTKLAAAT